MPIKKEKKEEQTNTFASLGVTVAGVVGAIALKIASARKPARKLPAVLNYATAIRRPGLSETLISTNIIEGNGKFGINTGQNPDGTENVVNMFVKNIVDCVVKAIREDAVVHCTIPAGMITVQAEGGNAGGPVVAVGSNITTITISGIIR